MIALKVIGMNLINAYQTFMNSSIEIGISKEYLIFEGDLNLLSEKEKDFVRKLKIDKITNSWEEICDISEKKLPPLMPLPPQNTLEAKPGDLMLVAFNEDPYHKNEVYGAGNHPFLVSGKNGDGSYRGFFCTSSVHIGKTVLAVQLNPNNFWAKPNVFDYIDGRTTYILFHQAVVVDPSRFLTKMGTFKKEMFPEFKKCMEAVMEDSFNLNTTGVASLNVSGVTEVQLDMLKSTDKISNLKAIAKNDDLSYDQKVSGILKVYGFFDTDDSKNDKNLFRFIKLSKGYDRINYDVVMRNVIAQSGQVFKGLSSVEDKLFKVLGRRFKYDIPKKDCLTQFAQLVNQLAS